MIFFLKGLFFDQASKISKMMEDLNASTISPEVDGIFLQKTKDLLHELYQETQLTIPRKLTTPFRGKLTRHLPGERVQRVL
jgi:hypothetical protein